MKNRYITPEMEIMSLDSTDIICESAGTDIPDDLFRRGVDTGNIQGTFWEENLLK